MERHWEELARQRRVTTLLSLAVLALALVSSLWFANESNAGQFFDRLPHVGDFIWWLYPKSWPDVLRALFNLPSPNADGTLATNFTEGRMEIGGGYYIPGYLYLLIQTINVALLSTIIGFTFGFPLSFLAAQNSSRNVFVRFLVRRALEFLRAFPIIVIAVLFAAFLSVGPVPAIVAVATHTVGALGKLFFEVVENADPKPVEGVRSVGATWLQQVRYAYVPQVLPNILSYTLLRLEVNVRESTIVGAVGGGGIGRELVLAIKRGHGVKAVAMMLLIFLMILAIDSLSGFLRRRLAGEQSFELARVGA
jgi:phosphonate transport system permease protein